MNMPRFNFASPNPLDAWVAARTGLSEADFCHTQLQVYQIDRFVDTVTWAKLHSPYYRHALADVNAHALRSLEDVRRLPFTTAEDLCRNNPTLLCVSQNEISRIVTLDTSGTGGSPKRLYFTPEDQEATIDFFLHGMAVLTRPGDRVAILFPGERPGSVGGLLALALRRLGATPILLGWPHDSETAALQLKNSHVDIIAGAPIAVLALAKSTGAMQVRSVLLSSDHVAQSLRNSLEKIWGCEVFEHYGMTEMGLGGGVDCTAHTGYHMRENDLLIELLQPGSNEPTQPEELGEIVISTLTRRGMPLIRYRTGDLSRLRTETCPCGSPLMRLDYIHGRIGTPVNLGLGILNMAMLDEVLLADNGVIDFAATYRLTSSPHLHLDIASLNGEDELPLLKCRLLEIPVLAHAVDHGLQLSLSYVGRELIKHAGKRRIHVEMAP
ncbi:DVU_1553 family AMP-dependent CoA ligase [Uliginosibacterium gangwonense]|uniref:DVU_1553 family AMP-dependent CoA ligase n=1 Tax=Uliginosibacterium gangwonense TaxID=392736 RepID=UPI0003A1BF65|nr:AMP-binding protein [Uliginosibacterium gangwonense]